MTRLVLILLTITLFSLGVAWIADEPGRVVIDWNNYHIESSLLVLIAAIAIGALWCMLIYYVLFLFFRSPRSWLRSRLAKRQSLGLEALTSAFAAIAVQDVRSAQKHIRKARQHLPHQPLTLMLASQVARLEGNESKSRLYLEQMLKSESTEFMAMRGLIESARRGQDDDAAIVQAEKAIQVKPGAPWLCTTLAGLYIRKGRTQEALKLLDTAVRKRAITRKTQRTLIAAALYEYAKPLCAQQRFDVAVPALKDSLKCRPDFAPATALLADAHMQQDEPARALKAIASAWKTGPHPMLSQALLKLMNAEQTRKAAHRAGIRMARQHAEHRESRYLLAAMALKNGDTDSARNETEFLVHDRETVRACGAMAEVETAAGHTSEASRWLERSRTALADNGYECEQCHHLTDTWQLSCPQCASVATLEWK